MFEDQIFDTLMVGLKCNSIQEEEDEMLENMIKKWEIGGKTSMKNVFSSIFFHRFSIFYSSFLKDLILH